MLALQVRIEGKESGMLASTKRLAEKVTALVLFICLFGVPGLAQAEDSGEELLTKLRSGDVFESQQAEAELLRLGPEALVSLSRAIEISDRASRFKASQLFSDLVGTLLIQYEREQHAFDRDQGVLKKLDQLKRATEARRELNENLSSAETTHPDLPQQLQAIYELRQLERVEEKLADQQRKLPEATQQRLAKLRRDHEAWKEADSNFTTLTDPLLELYELQVDLAAEYSDLDALRLKEVSERATEREPRVAKLRGQVLEIGHAALNEALARSQSGRQSLIQFYGEFVAESLGKVGENFVNVGKEFEIVRYSRGLLWAWEIERELSLIHI